MKYLHPRRKELVGRKARPKKGPQDCLGRRDPAGRAREDEAQAERIADSRLDTRNAKKLTGTMTLVGDELLVAGSNRAVGQFRRMTASGSSKPSQPQSGAAGLHHANHHRKGGLTMYRQAS